MKTLGMLGGMSWESTREYYRILNEETRKALGGLHSAKIVLHSFDFAEVAGLQHADRWDALNIMMCDEARRLEAAGAQALIICTNLMHKCAPAIEEHVNIPLLHIADAVGNTIRSNHPGEVPLKIALLGAEFTMREDFYSGRLKERYNIDTIIPEGDDFDEVSRIIYEELCQGKITESARKTYLKVIDNLAKQGAQGVILGCTEIPLLIRQDMCDIPLYDTTAIHACTASNWMLGNLELRKAS